MPGKTRSAAASPTSRAALGVTARLVPTAPGAVGAAAPGSAFPADATRGAAAAAAPPGDWKSWTVEGPIEITNDAPGTVDAQRVPVQRITTVARWRARQRNDRVRVQMRTTP